MKSLTLALLVALPFAAPLAAQAPQYVPRHEVPARPQVVAVYVGATDCGACRTPALKAAIRAMKPSLQKLAADSGREFAAIGVGLDWDVDSGMAMLTTAGVFDEVTVGSNWVNLAAQRFIWADTLTAPSLPLVVVYERTIDMGARITFSNERVLARFVGADEIERWVRQGTPLSFGPSAPPASSRGQ